MTHLQAALSEKGQQEEGSVSGSPTISDEEGCRQHCVGLGVDSQQEGLGWGMHACHDDAHAGRRGRNMLVTWPQ